MATDFAENELDLFRKAVSRVIPVAHWLGFLWESSVSVVRSGNCSLQGSLGGRGPPLLSEERLCREISLSTHLEFTAVRGPHGCLGRKCWARCEPQLDGQEQGLTGSNRRSYLAAVSAIWERQQQQQHHLGAC